MRQTGRTSRIINNTIDNLFQFGEWVSTDHVVFEYDNIKNMELMYFIDKVKRKVEFDSLKTKTIMYEIHDMNTTNKKIKMIYFKLIKNGYETE